MPPRTTPSIGRHHSARKLSSHRGIGGSSISAAAFQSERARAIEVCGRQSPTPSTVDETQKQRYAHFPSQLLQSSNREHHIRRRTVRVEPALLLRQKVPRLAVGAETRSGDLEKDLTCVGHE